MGRGTLHLSDDKKRNMRDSGFVVDTRRKDPMNDGGMDQNITEPITTRGGKVPEHSDDVSRSTGLWTQRKLKINESKGITLV